MPAASGGSTTGAAPEAPEPPAAPVGGTTGADDTLAAPDAPDVDGLTDAQRAAFARALEPRSPDAVTIAAAKRHGANWIVLHHIGVAARWRAAQKQGAGLERRLEALAEARERCEDEGSSENLVIACILAAAPDESLGWEALGETIVTWEIARLEGKALTLGARLVLSAPVVVPKAEPPVPLKLQVFDIDRDGSDEITVVVPADPPPDDSFTTRSGAIGAIVDSRTFARQFAVTRFYDSSYSHADDYATDTIEVRWFAADETGDKHPDLRVRETRRRNEGEGSVQNTSRKELCPYIPADDRWHCPDPPFAEGLLLSSTR